MIPFLASPCFGFSIFTVHNVVTVFNQGELRGECVIVVEMPTSEQLAAAAQALGRVDAQEPQSLEEAIDAGLAAGEPKTKLAKRLAKAFALNRAEVYDTVVARSSAQ